MRLLFYALLAANLVGLAYACLGPRHSSPDAELLNQQINPEKVPSLQQSRWWCRP